MRKIFVVFFILLYSSLIWSQKIDDVFREMPFEILPGLTDEDKEMMMIDTGKVSVPSQLGEVSKIEHSDTYVKFTTSKAGTTQIKILGSDYDSLIICVVKTVCDSICDSDIKFYSTDWVELDRTQLLKYVSIDSFLRSKDIISILSVDAVLPLFYPVSAELYAESEHIILKMDLEDVLSKDQFEILRPYIVKSEVELKWNGASFN